MLANATSRKLGPLVKWCGGKSYLGGVSSNGTGNRRKGSGHGVRTDAVDRLSGEE
jgi:hypothetical protein